MIVHEISGFSQLRGMRDLLSEHNHVQVHAAAKSIGTSLRILYDCVI